jgi:hypothetical protein
VEALLNAFSFLMEGDVVDMGDDVAINRLYELLQRQDIQTCGTKDGPIFVALLRHFGMIAPYRGQERLDQLEPEIVCKTLVEFEKLKLKLAQ